MADISEKDRLIDKMAADIFARKMVEYVGLPEENVQAEIRNLTIKKIRRAAYVLAEAFYGVKTPS